LICTLDLAKLLNSDPVVLRKY